MPRKKAAKEEPAAEAAAAAEAQAPPADSAGGEKVELAVHVDFEVDGRGVHIAPGVILAHQIPPSFLAELIERNKARLIR